MPALSAYALTDLDTCKEHLNVPLANTDYDDLIRRFINAATGIIEQKTARKLFKRSHTEFQDGRNNGRTLLRQWPADKPTEVWIDSSSEFTDSEKQLDTSDYELELDPDGNGVGIILINNYCKFPAGRHNVKLVYEAGYDPIPDDLAEACVWVVDYLYDMKSDRSVQTDSKGKGQETTRFVKDFPPVVLNMIEPYIRQEWPLGHLAVEAL